MSRVVSITEFAAAVRHEMRLFLTVQTSPMGSPCQVEANKELQAARERVIDLQAQLQAAGVPL